MKSVCKSVLKAKMLEIFRKIEASGEELIVTNNGDPVLKIVPLKKHRSLEEAFKGVRGRAKCKEDLTKPTIDEWGEV